MLIDAVCSLCSGQKQQNVTVSDKCLNVETVDTRDSGLLFAPPSLEMFITEVASHQQISLWPRCRLQHKTLFLCIHLAARAWIKF